jgi:hypothetical protein
MWLEIDAAAAQFPIAKARRFRTLASSDLKGSSDFEGSSDLEVCRIGNGSRADRRLRRGVDGDLIFASRHHS